MVSRVLGMVGASIIDAAFRISTAYTSEAAANFRAKCLARGYDIPWLSRAVAGSDMAATAGQISALQTELAASGVGWDIFCHCYGNDASIRGNYPANWDSTELSTYNALVDGAIASVNGSSATLKLMADLSYRFNVTGSQQINEDIIRPKLAAGLALPYVPWFAASKASADLGQYFYDVGLHPSDTGVLVLQDALLDAYIPVSGRSQTDIEDQLIIAFGDESLTIPNVTNCNSAGSRAITTQRKVTGGTCVLAGGTASSGTSIGAALTSFQFDATHKDFGRIFSYYGSFAPITVTVNMPAWANRAVRVRVNTIRAATGRETDITVGGVTKRVDPNGVTGPRFETFLTTMDGSGNLVINSTHVTQYCYLTSVSVDLLKVEEPPTPSTAKLNNHLNLGLHLGL